jgi:hypothetical protein
MAAGLSVIRQDDFSAGAFPNSTAERIPRNGFWSSSNMLVDDVGALYKRGGSTLLAGTSSPASQIVWVWQGTLTGGSRTLAATTTTLYSVSGGTFTSLGALTTMANGANRPAVLGGVMYLPPASGVNTVTYDGTTVGTLSTNTFFYNTSVANRLVFAGGLFPSQVSFSGIGTTTFGAADLWKIPGGAVITGLASLRDSAVVFTDQGTWVISNMALNLTDTAGNVQQRLDLYSPRPLLLADSQRDHARGLLRLPSRCEGAAVDVPGHHGHGGRAGVVAGRQVAGRRDEADLRGVQARDAVLP